MKVFIDEKETLKIAYSPFEAKMMTKQKLADYLMGKYDEGMTIYNSAINERMTLMSWLPFMHTIAITTRYLSNAPLGKNKIEIAFVSSTLAKPSNIMLEVSEELYKFLLES